MLYLVICWWGNENELPIRVFVRETGSHAPPDAAWRAAYGDESVCGWDMEVIEHERCGNVDQILSRPDAPAINEYLVACGVRERDGL